MVESVVQEEAPKAAQAKKKTRGLLDLVDNVKKGFDGLFEDTERK
jgi:hypothetical protein